MHSDFQILAKNSKKNPMVIISEKNKTHVRIIVDCGFTYISNYFWEKKYII